jgi:hypothetical protein
MAGKKHTHNWYPSACSFNPAVVGVRHGSACLDVQVIEAFVLGDNEKEPSIITACWHRHRAVGYLCCILGLRLGI